MELTRTIAAHAVAIGIARWPRHDIPHRTPIARLITIPVGRLPEDYATALRQREVMIGAAAREAVEAATAAQEAWTGRMPARALEIAAVYRAKYAIADPDSIGAPPPEGERAQARDYQLIRHTVVAPLATPARRTTAPTSFFGPTR